MRQGRKSGPTVAAAAAVVVGAAVAAGALPGPASAQEGDGTKAIPVQGEVLDAATGRPLENVMVVLHDLWEYTRTDELGYFRFDDVPRGDHELGVYTLGYQSVETLLAVERASDVLAINLDPAPVEIEGLTVDLLSRGEVEYRSFGQRFDYVGPEMMREYRERYGRINEIIAARFPAVRVTNRASGGMAGGLVTGDFCVRMTRVSTSPSEVGGGCALMFIDGMRAEGEEVQALHPEEVASMRFIDRLEARLIYGDPGRNGVLLIETRSGIN